MKCVSISQKTAFFIVTAVKTSNLTLDEVVWRYDLALGLQSDVTEPNHHGTEHEKCLSDVFDISSNPPGFYSPYIPPSPISFSTTLFQPLPKFKLLANGMDFKAQFATTTDTWDGASQYVLTPPPSFTHDKATLYEKCGRWGGSGASSWLMTLARIRVQGTAPRRQIFQLTTYCLHNTHHETYHNFNTLISSSYTCPVLITWRYQNITMEIQL
jgi:hypothetical protein